MIGMPFRKGTQRRKFQGDTEDKCVGHLQSSIKAAGIWIFKPQASAAWEKGESLGRLLHAQWLVNTPCRYMCSGNYWAIIPANYLVIKRWSLVWAVIWEAVAAFSLHCCDHILLRRPNAFRSQQIRNPFTEQLSNREQSSNSDMVQSSSSWAKRNKQ